MADAARRRDKTTALRTSLHQSAAALQLQINAAEELRRRLDTAEAELQAARMQMSALQADITRFVHTPCGMMGSFCSHANVSKVVLENTITRIECCSCCACEAGPPDAGNSTSTEGLRHTGHRSG